MAFAGMEWILVALVVIILFFGGAKKIPEFAQNLGRARGEYERGKRDVEREMATRDPPRAAPAASKRFCPKCGSPAAGESAFCASCGTALPAPVA
jgi:TatA/E family protein of Tat protein translocase